MTTAQDFLMSGGGAPAAKFEAYGTVCTGLITEEPELQQQRDFSTNELKFWPDGKPMMQLVVTLATDQRDPSIEDDDGTRRLFIKGLMKKAVQEAVRDSGAKGLEVGGRLTVTYVRDGQRKGNLNPPKEYQAVYVKAVVNALHTPDPTPAVAVPAAAPVAAPVQGFDISKLTPEQMAVIANMAAQNQAQPAVPAF